MSANQPVGLLPRHACGMIGRNREEGTPRPSGATEREVLSG
jgi:hypothetical protein